MNAPLSVIILPVPVGTGDNGVHRRAKPDYRHHKAQRTERWRPSERIPQPLDPDRLRQLAERFRRAVDLQHQALLAAGRSMLQAMQAA
jgi:hypothetical protein